MSSRTAARHRRPVRTRTPLAVIGDAVALNATTVSRRSAVIAASGGLIVTMALPAVASPLLAADTSAGSDTQTTSSQAVGSASSTVSAPAKAKVSFALTSLTTVDAAQYQHDEQVSAGERAAVAERASRATARFAAAKEARASTARSASIAADDDQASGDGATGAPGDDGSDAGVTDDGAPAVTASNANVIDIAKRYTGIKYRFGGTTPAGFDCSGFVRYVYAQVGVSLPRTAAQQAAAGTRVSASDAKAGDIISFTGKGGVYHNGIYLGGGKMIDSPRTGKPIDVRDVWSSSVVFTRVA